MADNLFVSADIGKIEQFERDSAEVIREFNAIRTEFEDINSTLLRNWQGEGADAYKDETDHVLEKIGGLEDVLKAINESVFNDIKEIYTNLDNELGEFNRNPQSAEESAAQ